MAPRADKEPEPFNNPFRDALCRLKRRLKTAPQLDPPVEPLADRCEPDDPCSDADLFEAAVQGTLPLDSGPSRVRAPERVSSTFASGAAGDGKLNLLADEHFDVRFSDRFIRGRACGVSTATLSQLERGEFAVRSHVDLHGMPLDDARSAVDEFLAEQQRRGERCVLVITGKGKNSPGQQGVLRENIPGWLACGPSSRLVLAFVTARACDGGEGALYVLLRRDRSRKTRIHVETGGGA